MRSTPHSRRVLTIARQACRLGVFLLVTISLFTAACVSQPILQSDFSREPGRSFWRLSDDYREPVGKWIEPQAGAGGGSRKTLSGAIETTSGTWESPSVAVEPFHYYRVTFRTKAAVLSNYGAIWFDTHGTIIQADNYHGIDPASEWTLIDIIVRAPQRAASMTLRFRPTKAEPLTVTDVAIRPAASAEALAWADEFAKTYPAVKYTPPADRWARLPRTRAKLAAGQPLNILMLGDSICNDTSNSNYELLVQRAWGGKSAIHVSTSVRGATGCDYYAQENRVKSYVLPFEPDLLVIAGISNGPDSEPVREVIRQVRAARPETEVLLVTGAVTPAYFIAANPKWFPESTRGRSKYDPDPVIINAIKAMPTHDAATKIGLTAFSEKMRTIADDEKVAYLDMRYAWDEYMQTNNTPHDFFLRDPLHMNARAKQAAGGMLAAFLSP